jgi:hypothetical protein
MQIAVRIALLANAQVNALTGTQFEQLPAGQFPNGALVEFGALADATGVLWTVQTGGDTVQEESPVNIATINTFPIYPDHFTLNDLVAPTERINVKLRDTSGVARVVPVIVRFTAL